MRTTIIVSIVSLLLTVSAVAADGGSIKGSLGYTPEMAWDYNGDNKINRVQFWVDIDLEKEGQAIKGDVRKYLKDLDSGRKIYHWANMQMTGDNTRPNLPATHLAIKGKTAVFTVNDVTYTITDSGGKSGKQLGTFLADDGFTKIKIKIYAGEVKVRGQ
jgi:hypothetical protein